MTTPAAHPASLDDLLAATADGTISDADYSRLGALLRGNADAQRLYIDYLMLDCDLAADHDGLKLSPRPIVKAPSLIRRARFALAAAILLTACGVVIVAVALNNRPTRLDPRQAPAPLASVTDVLDGTLMIDGRIATAGEVHPGRTVSLDAGEAEFMLPNTVTVRLRGSTAMTIHDAMNVSMSRGEAEFDCPPGAAGYTVHLPGGSRIVDLGTAFRVALGDGGRTEVRVHEGRVAWTTAGEDAQSVLIESGQTARLRASGPEVLASVDPQGTIFYESFEQVDVDEYRVPGWQEHEEVHPWAFMSFAPGATSAAADGHRALRMLAYRPTQRLEQQVSHQLPGPGWYTLSAAAAPEDEAAIAGVRIVLLADSQALGQLTMRPRQPGTWLRDSITIEIPAEHPLLGSPLSIQIGSVEGASWSTLVDDLRLIYEPLRNGESPR